MAYLLSFLGNLISFGISLTTLIMTICIYKKINKK